MPYVAAAVAGFFVGLHSDRTGERRSLVGVPALTGAIAILGVTYFTSLAAVLLAITVAILILMPRSGHSGLLLPRYWRGNRPLLVLPSSIQWVT
jgi:hypothetical protein